MDEFIKAASVDSIPPGSMQTCIVRGKKIAIANIDGDFFAIDDTCSHEECSLGTEGFLDQNVVTCGCHGAQFDVTNGDVISLPATKSVISYSVKIQGSDILIKL